jgi:phage repressor protein C with HTH and peptisase S24 domain
MAVRRLGVRRSGTASRVATQELVTSLLRDGTGVKVEVTGHSMLPFIRSGDVLTLVPLGVRELSPGDVLAAATARGLIVHRLVGRSAAEFRLRGDCGEIQDDPLTAGDIVGVVARVERRGRRVRLGLGPERAALAILSRFGAVRRLARLYSRLPGQRARRVPASGPCRELGQRAR